MSAQIRLTGRDMTHRWPHIMRYMQADSAGWVDNYFHRWWSIEDMLSPAERAAANDEWADFFEWCLEQRSGELAADRVKRHLVAEWTDSMAYCCRRSAAWTRGEDPGEWIPQSKRRPDLDAEGRAIVNETTATGGFPPDLA